MKTDIRLDPAYILQDDLIRDLLPTLGQKQWLSYADAAKALGDFLPTLGQNQWQVVYASRDGNPDRFGIYSALLPSADLATALTQESWDLSIGDGLPGFSQSWRQGTEVTTYHRFGGFGEIRPLVIYRHFHGAWPSYIEICEEFRHFHNLAEDRERGVLLDFDRSGYPIKVAQIQEHAVEIQLPYLLQFLAATQQHLAIFFDVVRYSLIPVEDILEDQRELKHADDRSRYFRHVVKCDFQPGYRTFSRLLGKVLVSPPSLEQCGKWPFDERKPEAEVSFVIGVNPDGTPREFTSHPDKLSNYFGANPGAPNYLTPVYFRKEVLSKYYADPDRYSVSDGLLGCFGLWSVQIDNNHPTHVVVFLGDLGRDLPYEERLHWRQFNVPPQGGVSETNFRRSFLAQFAPPKAADLLFRAEYQRLNTAWRETMGWPLFLEPRAGDEYLLATVRVPVTNSQSELDQQILALTKLLVDSLNEHALVSHAGPGQKDEKGITKLERFLGGKGFPQTAAVIQFLRDLQALRSSGAGHRKGSGYDKILAGLGASAQRKPELMERLLREGTAVLRTLGDHFCPRHTSAGSG
ncbi:hypothetical protein [Thermochromatium tepidum]|uniref:Uncharacterized protein n=1 Tax=Thermochromatium tepidum ATCC 43061 TaxID=316276 RepID=A0A6I6EB75_THETI|nr:hypothetical protein [Thermochromatium tepidum]QGU32179.1 hypothetical protein E6P07_03750 [Thermochromatium tepidum ATCC 43061]